MWSLGSMQNRRATAQVFTYMIWDKYWLLEVLWIAKWRNWHTQAFCKCECGESKIVDLYHLQNWNTKSCWCLNSSKIVLWSDVWNFKIIEELFWYNRRTVLCLCKYCWNNTTVRLDLLKNKKSCWCIWNKWSTTHWMSNDKIYYIWRWILQRCNDVSDKYYYRYWGRWIKCEWNSFEEFYSDMWESFEEWLTIDRINNDGNYCKANCRWATQMEQAQNRWNCIIKWWLLKYCRENNLNYMKIRNRIKIDWMSFDDAILFDNLNK